MNRLLRMACPLALLVGLADAASAQVRHLQWSSERRVGYFLGDLIRGDVDVAVDAGWTLRPASLPTPGRPTYWLDLRSVEVETEDSADGRRYRLHLLYQTFYAPLEARTVSIPGFVLAFERSGEVFEATVPAQAITMSPLREIVSSSGELRRETTLQADHPVPRLRLRGLLAATAASAVASGAVAVLLAWRAAAWPFGRRARRPFARALRVVRTSGKQNYANAVLSLHRAFDAAAGYRMMADDQGRFLGEHARYAGAAAGIRGFFDASRLLFFSENEAGARERLPPEALVRLARQLAAAERGAA